MTIAEMVEEFEALEQLIEYFQNCPQNEYNAGRIIECEIESSRIVRKYESALNNREGSHNV